MSEQEPLPPASSAPTSASSSPRTRCRGRLARRPPSSTSSPSSRLDVLSDEEVVKIARELGQLVVSEKAEPREAGQPGGAGT